MKVPLPRGWNETLVVSLPLVSLPLVIYGLFVRFGNLPDVFCRTPDEMSEVLPGLRLHALPFWNFDDAVRYTFLKSAFFSFHGLGDVSFYYLASWALSLLGLPISERWLLAAGGVASVAMAVTGAVFLVRVLDRRPMAWIFMLLVLVSPVYIWASRAAWARFPWIVLLLLLMLLCQDAALRTRHALPWLGFAALAGFIALTDGFYLFSLVVPFGLLLVPGNLRERARQLATDRVFLTGLAGFAMGLAVDVVIGLPALQKGTPLTLLGYARFKGAQGALLPTPDLIVAWAQTVDAYFPFPGAWVLVTVAAVVATVQGLRGRPIGFVAAWWWLASLAVIRYTAGLKTQGIFQIAWVNASAALAAPSLMLAAWMLGGLATASLPVVRALPPVLRGSGLVALLLTLSVGLGADAHRVAFGDEAPQRTPRFDSCRAVKAAAAYVRSHGGPNTYVFHLSSDTFLGHFGEYYYGLSYARSSRPEEPNHILDFGNDTLGRRYPPEAFYPAYGVKQFDYYVDFVDERDPFKTAALERLEREGARVVCVITLRDKPSDTGRVLGRILSFRDEPLTELEYHAAAAEWDRRFAKRRTLFQQPLAGTSYHFGYNWRRPE